MGFRWAAERTASSLGLTGWVKNCPDGTVEVLCEGKEDDVRAFLGNVKKEMGHYIRSADISWESAKDEFDAFNIKFAGNG